MTVLKLLEFIAILSCCLFAGAALYINLAEHPARMQCGTELAATVFGPSYKRAAKMQATLAVVATICAIGSWLSSGSIFWLVGAFLIFFVIPFTLVVIRPINDQLLAPNPDRRSTATQALLVHWGHLHAIRTTASLAATAIFLLAALGN